MWFLVLLLPLCSCCCQEENNTIWLPNEVLVMTLENLYENLPILVIQDTYNRPKRSFAIIAKGVSLYASSDTSDIQPTVNELIKILPEPADVIAADPRKHLDILRAIIDQPINDIKRACKPSTTSMACTDLLHSYQQEQTDKCSKYGNHIDLHYIIEHLAAEADFQTFLDEAITWSNGKNHGGDRMALDFFINSVAKYNILFERFRIVYMFAVHLDYPCINLRS